MSSPFVHMHVHDQFSILDGVGTAKQYAEEAAKLEMESLALTNHGNVDGCLKFQSACKKAGVRPVLGVELYVVQDIATREKEKRYHLCLLAKNEAGFKSILRILTKANLFGYHYRPRVDMDILKQELTPNLVVSTACASSFIHMPDGEHHLLDIADIVGRDSMYLEVMPIMMAIQKQTNQFAIKLSEKHGLRLLATNDCHYPTNKENKVQEVLLAIQSKAKWKDPGRWKFEISDLYLKTATEMARSFEQQKSLTLRQYKAAMRNSLRVSEQCAESWINKRPVHLPLPPGISPDADEKKLLLDLSKAGLYRRVYSHITDHNKKAEYRRRLLEEYGLITNLGFERYFLIVWELIAWCKENDIMTGPGRGSVGGSLLAYCMGITDVDPIGHNLIFSRFISPARIDLPDIDMDFEDRKRHLVRQHLEEAYGKDCVTGLTTFGTMKGRGALRDVSRVFDVPNRDISAASKAIVVRSGGDFRANFTIEDAFETFEDGKAFKKKHPEVTQYAIALEGQVRSVGQHAAAICVSDSNLKDGENCNLCLRNGVIVANWEKNDAEYMGLMKLDVLGLGALSVLSEAKKLIKQRHNKDIEYDQIPLDDSRVYDTICEGNCVGAFHIGSYGISRYCSELKPRTFSELTHANALWRPGTLRTGMTWEFIRRKNKEIDIPNQHPIINTLTKDTYGIILYQEQIMSFMYDLAGLPWQTCDTVRKVISKSQGDELFQSFKKKFIDGCVERNTLDAKTADKTWDLLSSFGSYGFNKAHAVEYTLISYWDMWLKEYYPAEFMAAVLTYGREADRENILEESKRLGLNILTPKSGVSHPKNWAIVGKNTLVMPLDTIKGVADNTAAAIIAMDKKSTRSLALKPGERRTAFFSPLSEQETKLRKPNKAILARLEGIHFYDFNYSAKTTEQKQELLESLSLSPFGRLMGVMSDMAQLASTNNPLSELEDILTSKDWKTPRLTHTVMKSLRFRFRMGVLKAQKGGEKVHVDVVKMRAASGTKDNMGGVYGYVQDTHNKCTCMGVFEDTFYTTKKQEIEHCKDGSELLLKTRPRRDGNSIIITAALTESMANRCDVGCMGLKLTNSRHRNLIAVQKLSMENMECNECSLRQQCIAPVPIQIVNPSIEVMLIGEAPGRDEDQSGEPFKGKAGVDILWPELRRAGLKREMLGYVANVVRCYPSKTKTPTPGDIKTCRAKWLDPEIEAIRPLLIMSFGNTGLAFFKGLSSGINQFNGTTEWSAKYKAWVCYCVHPASVIYESSNRAAFERGVCNFLRCYNELYPGKLLSNQIQRIYDSCDVVVEDATAEDGFQEE